MTRLRPHSIQYRHAGKTYTLDVEADSIEDAEARVRSAAMNGEAGEVVLSINAPGWLAGMFGERK